MDAALMAARACPITTAWHLTPGDVSQADPDQVPVESVDVPPVAPYVDVPAASDVSSRHLTTGFRQREDPEGGQFGGRRRSATAGGRRAHD